MLVACNKQDQSDARKAPQLEKELEAEMYFPMHVMLYREQIKSTRKATIDEQTVLGPVDVSPHDEKLL